MIQNDRTCIVTRNKLKKEAMIRVVKNKKGEILIDRDFIIYGRGCYLLLTKENVLKAQKKKSIERALKTKTDLVFVYQQLLELVNES